jgi:hypothetical protein
MASHVYYSSSVKMRSLFTGANLFFNAPGSAGASPHCHSVKRICKLLSTNCMYKVNTMLIYNGDAKQSILKSCL